MRGLCLACALVASGADGCTEWRPLTVAAAANGGDTATAQILLEEPI
jgi:hypothetical protein